MKTKRKQGRPRLAKTVRKHNQVNVRMSDGELAIWKAQAAKEHRTLAGWIRMVCNCIGG